MSLRTAAVICAVCLGVLRQSPAAQQADPEVTLDQVLERAANYVAKFIVHFSNVVAEERYVQDATAYLPTFNPIGRGRGAVGLAQATPALARHREIRSDFLLVRTAEVAEWQPFRDVYEVDGTPVRDREERVTKLFLQPLKGALSRVDQIQDEGARYNIGDVHRTINHPLVALPYVQEKYQAGVQFVLGKADRGVGPGVRIVEYREQASPTLIRGTYGRDLFATGRFWIEAQTGRLLKSDKLVSLSDRADHKPNELSGGQQQRVAIARALATNPSVILADEPTGNLDSQTGETVMHFLKDLHKKQGTTIVLVTHDPVVAKNAQRVEVLRDGTIQGGKK